MELPKKYSSGKWLKIFHIMAFCLIGILWHYYDESAWVKVGLLFIWIFSIVSLVAVFVDGVHIDDNYLVVVKNFKKTKVNKGNVNKVSWAKGCSITLILTDDTKVELPEIDVLPLNFRNIVMKWNSN